MAQINFLLHESALGYGLFEVTQQADSVGLRLQEVQDSINDLSRFHKMVRLVNFTPWS
jgi:nucleolar protein 56